jgi:hypothetical protein
MDADHEGSGGDFHRLSKTVGEETINIDPAILRLVIMKLRNPPNAIAVTLFGSWAAKTEVMLPYL